MNQPAANPSSVGGSSVTVLSVNVARPRLVQFGGQTLSTGIFKKPVAGEVEAGERGLAGDDQADKSVHGGPDKAIYVYSDDDYAWWREQLVGRELPPGEFGENLTVSGLRGDSVSVGDTLRIGDDSRGTLVQVTQPRTPCLKLGVKMQMPAFVKLFHQAGRPGFYLRVLEPGVVQVGDAIQLVSQTEPRLTIEQIYEVMFSRISTPQQYREAMQLEGLSQAWRDDFQKRLQQQAQQ